jgi:uncharacterized protein YggE
MKQSISVPLVVLIVGLLLAILIRPGPGRGQVGGNLVHSDGSKARAQHNKEKYAHFEQEKPPTGNSMFVHADVLMNLQADEYVAVFGIAQEAETVAECITKLDAVVKEFTDALKPLKIGKEDIYVDFVTQTKIYGFDVANDIAREKLVGFELKKTIAVHYKDKTLLDKLVAVAGQAKIYDLIKVDYNVRDIAAIQDKLMTEATKIIKLKVARHDKLLGLKLQPGQVYAEKYALHYPPGMYDGYDAAESQAIAAPSNEKKYTILYARKGKNYVFNGLNADGFDLVLNPVILEPVVQATLHLKVKYDVEQVKAK